jgi:hypothetical protein
MRPFFPKQFPTSLVLLASLASLGNRNQPVPRRAPLVAGAHIAARLIADPLRAGSSSSRDSLLISPLIGVHQKRPGGDRNDANSPSRTLEEITEKSKRNSCRMIEKNGKGKN